MLEFGDSIYYLDLKALDKVITIVNNNHLLSNEKEVKTTVNEKGDVLLTETYERSSPPIKEIDMAKYDILKTFIEYIIDYEDVGDDALGSERALDKTGLGYKIVFNTLLKEGILKEKV